MKEERLVLVALDEFFGFLYEAVRQRLQLGGLLDSFEISNQRDRREAAGLAVFREALRPVVVRIRDAEEEVEAVVRRQMLGAMAEVPLANAGRRVAGGFEQLGDGDLAVREADVVVR